MCEEGPGGQVEAYGGQGDRGRQSCWTRLMHREESHMTGVRCQVRIRAISVQFS